MKELGEPKFCVPFCSALASGKRKEKKRTDFWLGQETLDLTKMKLTLNEHSSRGSLEDQMRVFYDILKKLFGDFFSKPAKTLRRIVGNSDGCGLTSRT